MSTLRKRMRETEDFMVDAQSFLSLTRWEWVQAEIASLRQRLAELDGEAERLEEWAAEVHPELWAAAQERRDLRNRRAA
jgi:uncharacterized coiled-coil DUF342 family protein